MENRPVNNGFPLTATPEQLERMYRGEAVELAPAREGHSVLMREVDGVITVEYVPVADAEKK